MIIDYSFLKKSSKRDQNIILKNIIQKLKVIVKKSFKFLIKRAQNRHVAELLFFLFYCGLLYLGVPQDVTLVEKGSKFLTQYLVVHDV